jgi:hypothetical protein
MMKKTLLTLMALTPAMLWAQTFDFDLTKPQPVYNERDGYGYDLLPAPDKGKAAEPFYFSVRVDDGNYLVRVVVGGKKNANTTVRAEGRRLMAEHIVTAKAKDTKEEIPAFVDEILKSHTDYSELYIDSLGGIYAPGTPEPVRGKAKLYKNKYHK